MHQTMKPSTITEGSVSRHLDNVTIVIKTFERAKSVRMLMESLRLFYPFVPVIVIDDSREPLDAAWCDDNTTYVHTEYDIGLSEGRNRGVDLSKTEFTFIADDDFVFTPASRLDLLLKPLQNSGFCVAGSRMINYGHDEVMFHGSFGSDGTTLLLNMEKSKGTQKGYPVFDFCHNIIMSRTEFLRENAWNPELKLREHWDFFYRIMKKESGLVTMRADTSFDHYPFRNGIYGEFRRERNTAKYSQRALDLNQLTSVRHIRSDRHQMQIDYLYHKYSFRRLFRKKL